MSAPPSTPTAFTFRYRFATLPPLAKLGLWASGVAAAVAVVELLAWLTGLPITVLDKNAGGTFLIVGALVSLLAVLATERRPLSEYGLVTPHGWKRQAVQAVVIGTVAYAGYCLVAIQLGVFQLNLNSVTLATIFKATLAATSSLPIAVVEQIIFAGLLVGMLRRATNAWMAVLVPATVFAAFAGMAKPGGLAGDVGQRLAIGMMLLATLLAMLRLRTGSIVMSSGVLAGAIAVRKVLAKLRLLEVDALSEWAPWLAPGADPRQAPAMWLVLTLAIAAVGSAIYRRGERQLPEDTAVSASFKRIMPFSNLMAFAPLDRWLVELYRARFRVGLAYLPRLVFTLITSALTTVVSLPERLLAPRLLKHDVPPPVFIVGMQRSGTTFLHELMSADPQFRSPRNYEAFNPHGFLTGWLTTAAMTPLLMWRRPMDAVQMTVLSSQEEEFALAAMGSESPYWMLCFPRRISEVERYWHPETYTPAELRRWQRHYCTFLRKLSGRARRRLLLKNPVNTSRVAALREMFPEAKFVYIVRHPHAVYQSNMHFGRHGFAVFQLQDADADDNYQVRFLDCYRRATDACERDLAAVPTGAAARVRFEDLERDPVRQIERLYCELGWEISAEFRARLEDMAKSAAEYQKNRFAELPETERQQVDAAMGHYLLKWGYESHPSRVAA